VTFRKASPVSQRPFHIMDELITEMICAYSLSKLFSQRQSPLTSPTEPRSHPNQRREVFWQETLSWLSLAQELSGDWGWCHTLKQRMPIFSSLSDAPKCIKLRLTTGRYALFNQLDLRESRVIVRFDLDFCSLIRLASRWPFSSRHVNPSGFEEFHLPVFVRFSVATPGYRLKDVNDDPDRNDNQRDTLRATSLGFTGVHKRFLGGWPTMTETNGRQNRFQIVPIRTRINSESLSIFWTSIQ
jgi:hypothetical protein